MLIPDGSGALMRYQEPMQVLRPYSARVYGLDQAIDNLSELNDLEVNRPKEFLTESNTVTMPVFGLTHGVRKQALFGRVKAGAAYAYIEATPAGFVTDYNWRRPRSSTARPICSRPRKRATACRSCKRSAIRLTRRWSCIS